MTKTFLDWWVRPPACQTLQRPRGTAALQRGSTVRPFLQVTQYGIYSAGDLAQIF